MLDLGGDSRVETQGHFYWQFLIARLESLRRAAVHGVAELDRTE